MAIKMQQHTYPDRWEFVVNLDDTKLVTVESDDGVTSIIPDPKFQRNYTYYQSDPIVDMVTTTVNDITTNSSKPRLSLSGEQLYGHADEDGIVHHPETLAEMEARYKTSAINLAKAEIANLEPPAPVVMDIAI